MWVITNSKRNYIVYCHVFSNNKKYFGITCQGYKNRWGKGGSGYKGQLVYNAIEKYGWYNTKHYILFKNLTEEEAEQKEIELIARYNTTDRRYGYNVSAGGDTPLLIGANNPNSVKIICINTREVFDTMNEASIKHNVSRTCIYDCCIGKQKTAGDCRWAYYDDYIKDPDKYNELKYDDNYVKHKYKPKRVLCIETNVIYNSITEAANSVGVDRSTISKVCKGKRKTVGGYHWKYID